MFSAGVRTFLANAARSYRFPPAQANSPAGSAARACPPACLPRSWSSLVRKYRVVTAASHTVVLLPSSSAIPCNNACKQKRRSSTQKFNNHSKMSTAVVRLEGLPFRVSKEELLEFFSDCNLPNAIDSIHLIMNREGRASGLGYVELKGSEDIEVACKLSKQYIGRHNRYANIVECNSEELNWYLERRHNSDAKKFRVRMHGLPFRASEFEIAKWFEPESICSDVEIHMNREGRPSGDATAFFDTEDLADQAMNKDRAEMSGRYINLTKTSSRPLSRSGFFVRMSGLPFRATEQEIKDFFRPDADCVGVRIIYNRDGRPSGDAVAEFESDDQAERAMGKNREHLGSRFVILTREDAGNNGHDAGSSSGRFTIRMGGLPFRASVREIMDWFRPESECAHVRVLMNRDGRPSGEALAEFDTEEQAERAMSKNKQYMGERFVILTAQY